MAEDTCAAVAVARGVWVGVGLGGVGVGLGGIEILAEAGGASAETRAGTVAGTGAGTDAGVGTGTGAVAGTGDGKRTVPGAGGRGNARFVTPAEAGALLFMGVPFTCNR